MANNEAEITVVLKETEALKLIRLLAEEIQSCYNVCDQLAAMLGEPPFPRNKQIIEAIENLGSALEQVDG